LYRLSLVDQELILFMEFAVHGTLLKYVNSCNGLREADAQRLFGQLFSAVRHLHACHFLVHRDLKLENILLDSRQSVKLTDFGLSSTSYGNVMRSFVGTSGYQAPEILAGGEYDEKCDVWALGVCLFAMMECRLPFSTQSYSSRLLIDEVENLTFPLTFSPLLVDLLRRMFTIHANNRPSLLQLQSHPWLRAQVQPLAPNVVPQPIVFYRVPAMQDVLKFRRKPVKADPACLEKCTEFGVNPTKLVAQLKAGLTTPDTTTYFCCLYPLTQRPEASAIRQAVSDPLIPSARKREINRMASPIRRMSVTIRPSQSPVVVLPHATSKGPLAKLTLHRPTPGASKQRKLPPNSPRRY
jgi:serine/threonine protein kinase